MPDALVATFVAGTGATLSPSVLQSITEQLEKSGAANVRSTWLVEGQAADVFFEQPENQRTSFPRKRESSARDSEHETLRRADALHWIPAFAGMTLSGVDCIIQPVATRRKKLLLADMESTIIEQEMLDELADTIGIRDKVAAITARAMNGELDFKAALHERVGLLRGLPVCVLYEVAQRITLMPGAAELLATMKANGAVAWLVSGGFTCFAKPVADRLGFDRVFANELIIRDEMITGEVAEPIVDKNAKKDLLQKACAELGLSLAQTMTVGDGANDIPMLSTCNDGGGLGVAYHAKPNVRSVIPHQINHGDLRALLNAQGYAIPRS